MQSFHEQIIAAAVDQDQSTLSQILSLSPIDVLDTNRLSPAGLLLSIGNIASAEFLITNGASIDSAVYGAAQGGHQAYADALIGRGASINDAVYGAARGGQQAYADALIGLGASINYAVRGAARGGYQAYADALIGRGASINSAVDGAARGGHQAYADSLILHGASINSAVQGAAYGGHQADADALRRREPELIKRRADIVSMMSKDNLSFPAALTATDPDSKMACGIILYLATRPNSKTLPLATYLILDVWAIVLDYVTPTKLSIADKKQLGNHKSNMLFTMDRFLLSQDLRAYANGQNPAHKDRATSMAKAVDSASSPDKLHVLLQEQREIILGRNSNGLFARILPRNRDINPTKDGFQAIIEEHAGATGASLPSIKPCVCASAHCSGACQEPEATNGPKKQ